MVDRESQFQKVVAAVKAKDGTLLSTSYVNNSAPLKIVCSEGHQWETSWKSINRGAWCPTCAHQKSLTAFPQGYSINTMCGIATERGGLCLSSVCNSSSDSLLWECAFGHQWMARSANVAVRGSWCPECASGLYERICRIHFETLFGMPFPKCRPDWLVSKGRHQMEYDGYSAELGIAFEHNGFYHYSAKTHNHKLTYQQECDVEKLRLSKQHHVKLIVIPELHSQLKVAELRNFIKTQCFLHSVKVPANFDTIEVDTSAAYRTPKFVEVFQELQKVSSSKNIAVLSKEFMGRDQKLDFQCLTCNHVWQSLPRNIFKLVDCCPNCVVEKKKCSITDARKLAAVKNGQCLSTQYDASTTKMLWECEHKHQWCASYNQIQSGGWCPTCFVLNRGQAKKLGIDIYKQAAIKKGGECLSNEVSSCYDKLQFTCGERHIWWGRADMIKNTEHWCPECARIKKSERMKTNNPNKRVQ